MIDVSLLLVPESRVSLVELWDTVMAEVVKQLRGCGYAVDPQISWEVVDEHGFLQLYRVVPGPAILTSARDDRGCGSVEILLWGSKFGRADGRGDKDGAVWNRMLALQRWLEDSFFVASEVFDPDDPT